MLTLFVRRVIRLAVVLAGVTLVTFGILHVSGDPVSLMMPEAPEADRVALRQAMGFNEPLPVQFVRFLANTARGDFGNSFFHRAPALPLVLERMPTTLLLTVLALGLSLAIALPVGILSAVRRNSLFDHGATFVVFLGTSPLLLRIVRSSMLEVINLDYVRTARAKGVSERIVIWHHALINAALPLVTVAGLQFGILLGGAIVTETVFAVPGLGRLIVSAIRQLDFPIVQAGVFVLALIVVLVNFAVDLLYIYLNPQIRVR